MKLPHHDPLTQTVPDAMHTVKDVLEHLFRIIVGKDDNEKVEMQLGRRFDSSSSSTALGKRKRTSYSSPVSYCPTKQQLKFADERALSIVTPAHIDFRPRAMFVKPGYLKSHDWKQVR